MKGLTLGGALASLCLIAYLRRACSKTDQKIADLVGKLVIYQSSEGAFLAGMITKQCEQIVLSSLLLKEKNELYIDPPELVREATIEEKRQIVIDLGFKRASWTFPIWRYEGHRWNLLLDL